MPLSVVFTGAGVTACVDGSRPIRLTSASGTMAPLGSTTVTCTRLSRAACANAVSGRIRARKRTDEMRIEDGGIAVLLSDRYECRVQMSWDRSWYRGSHRT